MVSREGAKDARNQLEFVSRLRVKPAFLAPARIEAV